MSNTYNISLRLKNVQLGEAIYEMAQVEKRSETAMCEILLEYAIREKARKRKVTKDHS